MVKRNLRVAMTSNELRLGWGYLIVSQLILPQMLSLCNLLLPSPLSAGGLNFLFFTVNFLCIAAIFRRFLWSSLKCLRWKSFALAVGVGLLLYFPASIGLTRLICFLKPSFANVNDAGIASMLRQEYTLIVVGAVFLVPPVEETLFRGLIFGGLHRKNRALAYLLSTVIFAAVHVTGYIGDADPATLALCFLQYIPAGALLALAYAAADNIFAPITMHILINAIGISSMR